jgi:hypothetical protein
VTIFADLATMLILVTRTTKPTHLKWLGIIIMVSLNLIISALLAWPLANPTQQDRALRNKASTGLRRVIPAVTLRRFS